MSNDLVEINRKLAAPIWGAEGQVLTYLDMLPVCIAKLAANVDELKGLLARPVVVAPGVSWLRETGESRLDLEYLQYLRLASKDVLAGSFERLVETGLTLAEATFFAAASNNDLRTIAHLKRSSAYAVRRETVEAGYWLPSSASRQHAIAAAARP